MRHFGFLPVIALAIPVGVLAADQVQLAPGRWQVTIKSKAVKLQGQGAQVSDVANETHFICFRPEDARDPATFFTLDDPSRPDCKTTGGTVANGRVALDGECKAVGKDLPWTMSWTGTYDSRSYQSEIRAVGSTGGTPMSTVTSMDGKYVGPCTGNEEK